MQSYISHPHVALLIRLISYLSLFRSIDFLWKISEIIENMILSLISVLLKCDIFANCRKSRKNDIYVEHFYENVVFHAVNIGKKKVTSILVIK